MAQEPDISLRSNQRPWAELKGPETQRKNNAMMTHLSTIWVPLSFCGQKNQLLLCFYTVRSCTDNEDKKLKKGCELAQSPLWFSVIKVCLISFEDPDLGAGCFTYNRLRLLIIQGFVKLRSYCGFIFILWYRVLPNDSDISQRKVGKFPDMNYYILLYY